jgi:large subunit ribosomal protein L4
MSVATFTKSGTKATTPAKLDKAVFGLQVESHELLKQAYVAYLAQARVGSAHVKLRGEVSGGGRKPWKQKGTGNARVGSIRSPLWRGGGITFGPSGVENYTKKLSTQSKRQAIRQALSVSQDKIKVIETFECKDGKTAPTVKLLDKIGANRNVLLVVSMKDSLVERATRNVPNLTVAQANYLNVYDVLNADSIVISKKALEMVHVWLTSKEGSTK